MELLDNLNINTDKEYLYQTALTHTSYSNEHDIPSYERLEFLGDAVIELIMSDYLYKEKTFEEGDMTKTRAAYVCEQALYTYASDLNFDKYILLGSGDTIKANETIMADVFEAFTGAIYLDKGLEVAKKFVLDKIIPYLEVGTKFMNDYKSELQELVQTVKKSVEYEIINEYGPAHQKTFECIVKVDGIIYGKGKASSKKGAEQQAAKEALSKQAKIKHI